MSYPVQVLSDLQPGPTEIITFITDEDFVIGTQQSVNKRYAQQKLTWVPLYIIPAAPVLCIAAVFRT